MDSGTRIALAVSPFRTLTCRRCKQPVSVLELPRVFIDPATFVGGCCLRGKRAT